ncbi:hypothetical protein SUGI_0044610 [Cryptomeria japonica]|nr:hypothetical protein SUGI_0044610 [Cryptomeria japonica]
MVDWWWGVVGASIPAVVVQQIVRRSRRRAEEERLKAVMGREKNNNDVFVCERVCTSKRMLNKFVSVDAKTNALSSAFSTPSVSQLSTLKRTFSIIGEGHDAHTV